MAAAPSSEGAGIAARFRALPRPRRWALMASVLWAVVVLGYAIGYFGVAAGSATRGMLFLDGLLFLVALVLPAILLWLAAYLAEELARQREIVLALAEFATSLVEQLDATRMALERYGPVAPEAIRQAVQQGIAGAGRGDALAGPVERIAAAQTRLQASLDALAAREIAAARSPDPQPGAEAPARAVPRAAEERRRDPAQDPVSPPDAPQETEQPALPLMPAAETAQRLVWDDLVRALDFPRDASDREGFRALRAALSRRSLAQMLQAAEDVLTILSKEGIYVDDLAVTPAVPEEWRRFIAGARGASVAGVGGITDAEALATTRRLLRSDPIFRDTALFFQRRFDTVLSDHAAQADDAQIVALADTRSGRAFMLLAKLSGAIG